MLDDVWGECISNIFFDSNAFSSIYNHRNIILVTPMKATPHLQKPQGQNGGFKHLLGATKTSFLRGGGWF